MKELAITVCVYVAAALIACGLAGLVSWPFLRSEGCMFPVYAQMMFIALFTGFYVLAYVPLVVMAHVVTRKLRFHRRLPLVSISLFGALFPLVGILFDRYGWWWPEEPIDMDTNHAIAFLVLALVAGVAGMAVAYMKDHPRRKRSKNFLGASIAHERENVKS